MKKILILFLLFANQAHSQNRPQGHNYSDIKPQEWIIPRTDTLDYAFDQYLGQKAFFLKRKIDNYKSASIAYPKNLKFKDGTIELDIAWPGKANGFVGLAFRIADARHYEVVYFRPESSGTINAIQYMPEKQKEFNWWNYESDKYQAKATLPLHAWFHVKAVVKASQLTVFINNQPKAVLVYPALDSSLKTGSVGFWLGNSAVGAYRNLIVK